MFEVHGASRNDLYFQVTPFNTPSQETHDTHKLDGAVFYRTGVIADRIFALPEYEFSTFFCSCDLDLDPMTLRTQLLTPGDTPDARI